MSVSHADKPVSRRTVVAAGAWSLPAVLATGALPAFAAASPGSNPAAGLMAFKDTEAAITNTSITDGRTWPHGLLSSATESNQVKFQLGMEMLIPDGSAAYQPPITQTQYKEWVSGPITVRLTFDATVYSLISDRNAWLASGNNGWGWSSTSTASGWTTLTFTHAQIAYQGNTQGIPTQTGGFVIFFNLLRDPGAQPAPVDQPANNRTVTDSMKVQVDSDLYSGYQISYVQENSNLIGMS